MLFMPGGLISIITTSVTIRLQRLLFAAMLFLYMIVMIVSNTCTNQTEVMQKT